MNLGAPFLDSHCSYGCDNVIGAVVPGSAEIKDGRGLARVQLSKAPGVADTVQKIREGVIRNVSVGYWIHKVEKTEADDGSVARWDVVDWEPLEISAVPIPADAASQIRSEQDDSDGPKTRACLIVTRNPASRPNTPATSETPMASRTPKTAPKGNRTAKTPAEIEAEKKRKAEERAAARRAATRGDDEEDEDRSEEEDEEREEDSDEDRDGDEDGDAENERDADDTDSDDEDRDGDDDEDGDEGDRAASTASGRGKRKSVTAAEVREAAQAAVRADRVRCSEIRDLADRFGFPKLGERHAAADTTVRAFKEIVLEKLAARQAKRGTTTFASAATAGVGETYGGAAPKARDFDKGAAEARALLGKK